MNKISLLFAFLIIVCSGFAQSTILTEKNETSQDNSRPISFVKNSGQWNEEVVFKASLGGMNTLFLEEKGFTYVFTESQNEEHLHEALHEGSEEHLINHHAYKVHFKNSKAASFIEQKQEERFNNYFIGNDEEKWASNVPVYKSIVYDDLYERIDLNVYSLNGNFKYDFIIHQEADPQKIELEYEGANNLRLKNGKLIIETSVGEVIESSPFAYQIVNGEKVKIECEYYLEGTTVSYEFPNGYDTSEKLIIDPEVIAATLSGMTDTYGFGMVATYDSEGNIFSGGRAHGVGYPATTGAYQIEYGGGASDIVITKFNSTGTEQIYATYLGGEDEDTPHSIIADPFDNLYIMGSTKSQDYPISMGAFQDNKNDLNDIIISKLSVDGSTLLASTFVGGSGIDGINNSVLNSNYDDHFRSEIIVDEFGNPFVISNTKSADFPVTTEAYDTSYNAEGSEDQDAVVFKMNLDLSEMIWATFLGGDDADTGFGIRVDEIGNVYVTGIAGADNFPTTVGVVQEEWPGGEESAYVAIFNPTGSDLLGSTFWGTSADDHAYLLDLDEDNQIHIIGQTTGTIPITDNTYFFNEGSTQFLSAFSEDLTELVYSTVIGTGVTAFGYDFVPVAFGVDICNYIYFSGYYAAEGLPLTSDAFYTEGGAVYIGVLEPLASALHFGTYYGDADHADGGMSRFDKHGILYQGICSCTNGSNTLNTLPGAFAEEQTSFCDIGVFKIDFEANAVIAIAQAMPGLNGDAPFEVNFESLSRNATGFLWDFDDNGANATEENASHIFDAPGVYEVQLIASNSATCNLLDTTYLIVKVNDPTSTIQIANDFELWLEPNLLLGNQSTNLFIKGEYTGRINYSIFDSQGRLLSENYFLKNGEQESHSLKTPSVTGVYSVVIKDEEGTFVRTLRFVVL